jgi:arylsulfatase A-like enzyme
VGADAAEREAARRPNILFLLTDDQRADTIHALGNTAIVTPHLDRLVREGTTFTRAVSPNPLCVPSRKEILSGCCGIRNAVANFGARFEPDQVPLPRVLREAGYHTWYVGKWHTEGRPKSCGYEGSQGLFTGGGTSPESFPFDHAGRPVTGYRGWVFQTDESRLSPEKGIGLTPDISRAFADAAIELIRRRPHEPFFLHVNFTAPHDPLLIPPGYEGKYDPAKIPLPANFLPEHPFDHGNFKGRDELLFAWPRTPQEVGRELAAYYAVISHLDEQIGRILAALDQTGQASNTVVIFSSDQGLAIGSHGLRGKQNMYEHTVGVPIVFRGPGVPRDARRNAQCYLRDLYPTICGLAGAKVPAVVQGKSLLPALGDPQVVLYPEVFGYFGDVQRMIRTDRWKLIDYPKITRHQLFDLRADPLERKDLSADPQHAATMAELSAKLRAWQQQAGDPAVKPRISGHATSQSSTWTSPRSLDPWKRRWAASTLSHTPVP